MSSDMLNEVQRKIVDLVNAHWEARHVPLFMATLGGQLRRELSAEKLESEFLGGKLKSYIEHNLGDAVKIVPNPPGSVIWALVPDSVTWEQAEATLPQNSDSTEIAGEGKAALPYVRYDRALWLAFTTPNLTSTDRYILLGNRIGTAEISKGGSAPAGAIKVEPSDLEHPDAGYAAIAEKIEAWASRNKVDLSNYKKNPSGLNKKSLLDFLIETLSDADLHQTAMPLSAIKALAEKKI
jgi:hypothetical protein